MEILAAKVIATLLLPPGGLIILGVVGILVFGRWRRLGAGLVVASIGLFILLSTPAVGKRLLRSLERYPPLEIAGGDPRPGAIVVLGGGHYPKAPEYGGLDSVEGAVLERLRYAVWLHKRTGLPILIAAGSIFGKDAPEGIAIARSLREDFGIAPKWVETRSRTTRENARYTKQILDRAGIRHIYLVTHAWHMRRAAEAFARTGLTVTPAPTRFATSSEVDSTILGYLPSIGGLVMSTTALHEYLGWLWYRLTD